MTTPTTPTTAAETLHALTLRLSRLEHLLAGSTTSPIHTLENTVQRAQPLTTQHQHLQQRLHSLLAAAPALQELLLLHSTQPHLFNTSPAPADAATILLASAPKIQSVAAMLNSLSDTPVPEMKETVKIVECKDRVEKCRVAGEEIDARVAELRERTVRVLERWWVVGVEGAGECAVEWEGRLRAVEGEVRGVERGREEAI